MKKIAAILRGEKIQDVKSALEKIGIYGLNIWEVKGRGVQKGVVQQWKGTQYVVDMIPKIHLEVVVKDNDVDKVIDTIVKAARTGNIGDGKIFVSPVEEVVRVRTGERGDKAI